MKTSQDIDIEDRLSACGRKEAEHIIYIGELVERLLTSEFGAILKALTAGRISMELESNKDGKLSSDRILGRLEMAQSLWSDLEQFVLDKDLLLRPIPSFERQPESISVANERVEKEENFQYAP